MNGSAVRTAGDATRRWRMRQWPNDPTVAHLIFIDHLDVPDPADVAAAIEHARRKGARTIRTSALFPRTAELLLGVGFHEIDRLALLQLRLARIEHLPDGESTRPMLPWQLGDAAHIDQEAFGLMWGNDASSLRDIRKATPHHRARLIKRDRAIAGIAMSGAAGVNGYLQRLAVGVSHRRQGIARSLVVDAVTWMHRRGLASAMVNTGVANAGALALYEQLGFQRLDDELTIAEHRLTG